MAKWFNTEVCKTSIHRFESGRRLHSLSVKRPAERSAGFVLQAVLVRAGERGRRRRCEPGEHLLEGARLDALAMPGGGQATASIRGKKSAIQNIEKIAGWLASRSSIAATGDVAKKPKKVDNRVIFGDDPGAVWLKKLLSPPVGSPAYVALGTAKGHMSSVGTGLHCVPEDRRCRPLLTRVEHYCQVGETLKTSITLDIDWLATCTRRNGACDISINSSGPSPRGARRGRSRRPQHQRKRARQGRRQSSGSQCLQCRLSALAGQRAERPLFSPVIRSAAGHGPRGTRIPAGTLRKTVGEAVPISPK